jgi:murein DD-endopeptidase MepM/ murein hydrolase activator NlpD
VTDAPPASDERPRPWFIDAVFGASLALGLITVANAALPRVQQLARSPGPAHSRAAPRAAAAAPAEPPTLIAFQEPIPGYPIISPFGLRQLPWEEGGRLHAGVDIAAPAGLPVAAAADGVVTRVDTDAGYGRFVEVKHAAGLSTRYAHLGRFLPQIVPGVAVKAGTPVGEIGSTGSSTGAHLHFEIRDDQDRPLNPELFLGRRFADASELPLRQAERFTRNVRVAYVSNIPKARREEMQAKVEAQAAADASQADAVEVAENAGARASNVSAVAPGLKFVGGRPQARLTARN